MADPQKLVQALQHLIDVTTSKGLEPISVGVDIAYEAGRRIGVVQGMKLARQHAIQTITESDDQDKDL